jgi:hypothetical protein
MKTIFILLAIFFTLGCKAQTLQIKSTIDSNGITYTYIDTTMILWNVYGGIPNGITFPSTPTLDSTNTILTVTVAFTLRICGDEGYNDFPHQHTFTISANTMAKNVPDSVIPKVLNWLQKKYYINGLNAIGN